MAKLVSISLAAAALDQLLRAIGDPLVTLSPVGPGHPEFAEAQLLRAGVGILAKTPAAFAAIGEALGCLREPGPRALAHIAAADAWLREEPVAAAERYAAIVKRYPHDLLALRLALSSFFFVGARERSCEVIDAAMSAWDPDEPGFGFVLALTCFAHAETGDSAHAEMLGRQALARDPACPLGVHAVAHAIGESGRPREGARWMREQRAHWATQSRMRTHNAWHLAMFDVDAGDIASALDILDHWLLPASQSSPLDACDAAALLWRLEIDDDRRRWRALSAAFERSTTPGFWPFVDVYAGLAHTLAGERSRAVALRQAIARRAEGRDFAASRARRITVPYLRAFDALDTGHRDEAADVIARLGPELQALGGSAIQQALFARIKPASGSRGLV